MVQVWPVAFLLSLLVVGSVSAGSAEDPEIVDARGDTDLPLLPGGDILAAWIEDADATGFTTVIVLAGFDPRADAMTDHYFSFRIGDGHWCTYVYVLLDGYEVSACGYDADRRLQDGNFRATEGGVDGVGPAHVRARFPLEHAEVDGTAGYTLTDLLVETFDFKRAGEGPTWPVRRDTASSSATFTFTPAGQQTEEPAPAPPADQEPTPGIAAPLLIGALAALGAAMRRRA